ncbi:MAG TPA: cyanophycin synthetase [Gaiellaceae bacterium]|nr:cyanophycin synthetase [Gaiellaceae bacterium]
MSTAGVDAPLAGRRIYFVGIGGAGLSAYANIARAWGAEVRGWDVRETIFMETLVGVEIDIGDEPSPPGGFEVVVSSAHTGRTKGRPRAELLSELVGLRRSIVVGGAHGKTTTAAMIAYALRELGRDPSWIVGGVVPQLGGNAGAGAGEWLVVEGDESDRSIALLEPDVAVVTNIELDHHATFSSETELAALFASWLDRAPAAVRGWELAPVTLDLAVPGEHNRLNAAAALTALELAGVDRGEAEGAIARFRGVARRFELVGERGGVRVYDDYGHNPTEIAATLLTARERTDRALIAVYQPHVYERTRHLSRELGAALGLADAAVVTDVIGGRDPRPGVTGKLVLDNVPSGVRRGWAPTLDDAARLALAFVRPGDVVVTLGVGEPWRVARAITDGLPG